MHWEKAAAVGGGSGSGGRQQSRVEIIIPPRNVNGHPLRVFQIPSSRKMYTVKHLKSLTCSWACGGMCRGPDKSRPWASGAGLDSKGLYAVCGCATLSRQTRARLLANHCILAGGHIGGNS